MVDARIAFNSSTSFEQTGFPAAARRGSPAESMSMQSAIRTGVDVFKALALGADAVLIGRPYVVAACGGGAEGVTVYTQKVLAELRDVMKMTGCATLSDITRDKITWNR